MKPKKKAEKKAAPQRRGQFSVRLTADEVAKVRAAAAPWPAASWARITLVKAADEAMAKRKGGRA